VRLHKALFLDASPAPTKFAMAHLGLCEADVRLPIAPCSDAVRRRSWRPCARRVWSDDQADRREPPRAVRLLHRGDVRGRLMLTGTEVKSLRVGRANIAESYASVEGREIKLINADIPPYGHANRFNHEPRRHRKLLLHRKQIDKLIGAVQRDGRTLIPLKLYWNEKGLAKLEIGLAKGKKNHDKRETEAARDWQRDKARLMKGDRGD
jgi:SsrA-binding protein